MMVKRPVFKSIRLMQKRTFFPWYDLYIKHFYQTRRYFKPRSVETVRSQTGVLNSYACGCKRNGKWYSAFPAREYWLLHLAGLLIVFSAFALLLSEEGHRAWTDIFLQLRGCPVSIQSNRTCSASLLCQSWMWVIKMQTDMRDDTLRTIIFAVWTWRGDVFMFPFRKGSQSLLSDHDFLWIKEEP